MKKLIASTLCLIMSLTETGYVNKPCNIPTNSGRSIIAEDSTYVQEPGSNTAVKMPNPFIDCETLTEASKIAGFEINTPEKIEGYSCRKIMAIENDLIQVIYFNEDETPKEPVSNDIFIRKAIGSEDISGVYIDYPETEAIYTNGLKVIIKGSGGKANIAIWTDSGYTFAVTAKSSIDREKMLELVAGIK